MLRSERGRLAGELVVLAIDQTGEQSVLDETTTREASPLESSPEVAANPVLTPCRCAKPAISIMDYVKHSPDNWSVGEPRVNRVCTRCWAHWFGPPDTVRFFTSAEWDKQLSVSESDV